MSSPDTRPRSNEAADIAKWQAEQERLREERQFREETSEALGWIKATLSSMQASFDAHIEKDDDRFGAVNQTIGDNGSKLQWILGGVAGVTGVLGVAAIIWSLLQ